MNFTILVLVLAFVKIFSKIVHKNNWHHLIVGKVVNLLQATMEYGMFLAYFESSLTRVSMYAFLQLKNTSILDLT
jgi:hypothetical protein